MIRLVTNHASDTATALRRAARRLHADLRPLAAFASEDELRSFAPAGAVVFLYGWPDAAERAVDQLLALGVPVAVWQVDDPHYFRSPKLHELTVRVARKADAYFTHTDQLAAEYLALGVEAIYLPTGAREVPGAEPLIARPPAEAELERDWAFVGTLSSERRAFLDELRARLPRLNGDVVSGVSLAEAQRIYRTTRVTLALTPGAGAKGEPSWGLTERSFEVPFVGGFLLQGRQRLLPRHFAVETEAATFEGVADAAEKIARFVLDPDARRAITLRAQARVWREHCLHHRLLTIVRRLLEARRRLS